MQLPTIPTFVTGEANITHLQQLSQAVSMCSVAQSFPMWRIYGTGTQALTANTWNQLHIGSVAIDTDGVYASPGNAVIVTQGYYECESCTPFEDGGTTSFLVQAVFKVTAGANNPHHTNGTYVYFGGNATWEGYAANGVDTTICQSGKCPWVCYPGDTINLWTYPLAAVTVNNGQNGSATAGWFTPQFSGRWISAGS